MNHYLVIYSNDDVICAAALPAPSSDTEGGIKGFPDSTNAILWELEEHCEIIAVIGIPSTGAERVEELLLWIDEQEIKV